MKWVILITLGLAVLGCNIKKNESSFNSNKKAFSMNQPITKIADLKKAVLREGDTNAYYELKIAYLDNEFPEEFLIFSLIMANKYDYLQAYFDVFTCLTDVYLTDISKIDEKSANLAIEYLFKAQEKGHHQAKDIIKKCAITKSENSKQQIERIFKR